MEVVVFTSHRSRAGTSSAATHLAATIARAGQRPLLAELNGSSPSGRVARVPRGVEHRGVAQPSELAALIGEGRWPAAIIDLGDMRRADAQAALLGVPDARLVWVVPMEADAIGNLEEASSLWAALQARGAKSSTLGFVATRAPLQGVDRDLAVKFAETCGDALFGAPVDESSSPARAYDAVSREIVRRSLPAFPLEAIDAAIAEEADQLDTSDTPVVEASSPPPSARAMFPGAAARKASQYTFVVDPATLEKEATKSAPVTLAIVPPSTSAGSAGQGAQTTPGPGSKSFRWLVGAASIAVFCIAGLVAWLASWL